MNNELIKVSYENENPTVSARELYDFLELNSKFNDWFRRMSEYGFTEHIDFEAIAQKKVTAQGNETTYIDYQLTIDMAKELCMIQRNDKGKQARQYFLEIEKRWNNPDMVMARALKMADGKIKLLEGTVGTLNKENDLLSAKNLTWANRNFINAAVRQFSGFACDGKFGEAWTIFKKELLYKHSINLNSRITLYLNNTGKKTKPKTLDMLDDSEIPNAVSTIVSLCRDRNVDISDLINKLSNGEQE